MSWSNDKFPGCDRFQPRYERSPYSQRRDGAGQLSVSEGEKFDMNQEKENHDDTRRVH